MTSTRMINANEDLYRLTLVAHSNSLPEQQRNALLAELDRLVLTVWELDPHIYRKHPEFLADHDPGIVLTYCGDELIGFSLYQRLDHSPSESVVYRFATAISPLHQGRGLYARMSDEVFDLELERRPAGTTYCAWRTRNPKVWASLARRCSRVCPPLKGGAYDAQLAAIAIEVATVLYPDQELITPSMQMPNAYDFLTYRHRQYYHDRSLERLFAELPDRCAVWSVGELSRDSPRERRRR